MEKPVVLFLDDEKPNLVGFKASFREEFKIYTAETVDEARDIMEARDVEVLVCDQRMPELSGAEFMASLGASYPAVVKIMLTGYTDMTDLIDAVNLAGIWHYMNKPYSHSDMLGVLNKAVEVSRAYKNKDELVKKLQEANRQLELILRNKLLS